MKGLFPSLWTLLSLGNLGETAQPQQQAMFQAEVTCAQGGTFVSGVWTLSAWFSMPHN